MRKKFFSIGALIVACFAAVGVLAGCGAQPKTFSKGGISVTLTSEFQEVSQSGFVLSLSSKNKAFLASKETFELVENAGYSTDMSLEDYAQLAINNNHLTCTVQKNEEKNLVYFIYHKTVSGQNFCYYVVVEKGSDAFWLCNFACYTSVEEKTIPQFEDWATTIVVE